MVNFLTRFWPMIVGVITTLAFASQALYGLGTAREDMAHAHEQAAAEIGELDQRLDAHEQRASHETTAIRLERIEVTQTAIARDVERMSGQLDNIADDLRDVVRTRGTHGHDR